MNRHIWLAGLSAATLMASWVGCTSTKALDDDDVGTTTTHHTTTTNTTSTTNTTTTNTTTNGGTGGIPVGGGGVGGTAAGGGGAGGHVNCDLVGSGPAGGGCPNDPTTCVCVGCTDDGTCDPSSDDCVCADCASDSFCTSNCTDDGVCDAYNEACSCADCAPLAICGGGTGGAGGTGGGGGGSPCANGVNDVADGGLEAGPGGGDWTEASTNFDTPICDTNTCGTGNVGPASGTYWAWFGGYSSGSEISSLAQSVTIGTGSSAELVFMLALPHCDSAADFLRVSLDGTQLFRIDGSNAVCGTAAYAQQTFDVTSYADGAAHTLEFYSETSAVNGSTTNFMVDDIGIWVCP